MLMHPVGPFPQLNAAGSTSFPWSATLMLFNTAWKGITWLLSLHLPLVASKSMCFLPQRSITHDIQPQYFQNYWSEKEQGIQNASEDFT